MKALRTLKQVQNGQVHLHLPKQFWGQQVEIIVLSGAQQEGREEAKVSLRGCLRQYANPSLAAQEEGGDDEVLTFDKKLNKHLARTKQDDEN